jgi:hypothetical protein
MIPACTGNRAYKQEENPYLTHKTSKVVGLAFTLRNGVRMSDRFNDSGSFLMKWLLPNMSNVIDFSTSTKSIIGNTIFDLNESSI